MHHHVYALFEVRHVGSTRATFDLYKVCPTFEDCLDVYREKVGEPRSITEHDTPDGRVWHIDEDATGAAYIARYILHGSLEEV